MKQDNLKDNSQKEVSRKGCLYESLASWLLFICAVSLIVGAILGIRNIKHVDNTYELKLTVVVDSTGTISNSNKEFADSISAMIEVHNRMLADKYQYILNQESNTKDMLTMGSLILGVIVSVVGFFGYKSMKSIEEKVESQARQIAEDASQDVIKKKLNIYKEELQDEIKNKIIEEKASLEKDIAEKHQKINNVIDKKTADAIIEIKKDSETLEERVSAIEKSDEDDDERISKLSKRINMLELNSKRVTNGRKSLRSAPPSLEKIDLNSLSVPSDDKK